MFPFFKIILCIYLFFFTLCICYITFKCNLKATNIFMRKSFENNFQCLRSISCTWEAYENRRVVKYFVTFFLFTATCNWTIPQPPKLATLCLKFLTIHCYRNCNSKSLRCKLDILQFSDVQEF